MTLGSIAGGVVITGAPRVRIGTDGVSVPVTEGDTIGGEPVEVTGTTSGIPGPVAVPEG